MAATADGGDEAVPEPTDETAHQHLDQPVEPLDQHLDDELETGDLDGDPGVNGDLADLADLADVGDVDESLGEAVPFVVGDDIATRVAHATARHGRGGGMLAAGMLGLDQMVNGRKPRDEVPVVVAANSDPLDIDTDGIAVRLEHVDVVAPPLPRTPPVVSGTTSGTSGKRRRWR